MNLNSGYIKLHRSILEWEWWDDVNTYRLFTYLLLTVNFEEKKWHGITIKRGQVLTSLDTLSKDTGLSVGQVRRSLTRLISTSEITSEATNQYRIITICNYDTYQGEQQASDKQTTKQSDNQTTSEQQASNKQTATTKEYKNDNNIITKEDNKENTPTSRSKKENTPKFNFKGALIELGVEPQMAEEWATIRKAKNKVNTEIALHREVSQMNKAGLSVADAVNFCIEYQWGQFRADWYFNSQYSAKPTQRGGGGFMTDAEAQAICDAGMKLHEFIGRNRQ